MRIMKKKKEEIPYYSPNETHFQQMSFQTENEKAMISLKLLPLFMNLCTDYIFAIVFWVFLALNDCRVIGGGSYCCCICKSTKSWWAAKDPADVIAGGKMGNEGFWCLLLLFTVFRGIFFFFVFVPIHHDSLKVRLVPPSSFPSIH